jgi:hypothetical protein
MPAADDRDELLTELASMPEYLDRAVSSLSAEDAVRPGPDGAFSPVEHAWHLADLETEGFAARIRLLLDEERPFLPDFDGDRLARERSYRTKSLGEGLAAFRAARRATLAVLRAVPDAAWRRTGVQEHVGEVALGDIPRLMREHDAAHRAELAAWAESARARIGGGELSGPPGRAR